MSKKTFYIIFVVLLLALVTSLEVLQNNTDAPRYHQHLEESSEADLAICEKSHDNELLCTHLPIIKINTNGQKIPGKAIVDNEHNTIGYETGNNNEEEILVEVSTIEKKNTYHHASDETDIDAYALFRIRGNSSRAFSKSSYRIKLVEKENTEQKVRLPLLGMEKESEWALHGPFLDKSLVRNYMLMNISAQVMGYAPNVRFCELIIDDKYQGLYVLMETITQGEGRVDISSYENNSPITSYLLQLGSNLDQTKSINNFTKYTLRIEENGSMEIGYPTEKYLTEDLKQYIDSDFSEIERIIYSSKMVDGSHEWQKYIDMESFVDYYILQEFFLINDAFSNSTFFYKDVRGKLHIGPVWDYNNAFDNFFRPIDTESFLLSQKGWYAQLMKDDVFVEAVIKRYKELRKNILSDAYLNNYLDQTIEYLGSAVDRNFQVWGYSFDVQNLTKVEYRRPPIGSNNTTVSEDSDNKAEELKELNPQDHDEAVLWLRNCMNERGKWMDEYIDTLRQYCSDSKNANEILY